MLVILECVRSIFLFDDHDVVFGQFVAQLFGWAVCPACRGCKQLDTTIFGFELRLGELAAAAASTAWGGDAAARTGHNGWTGGDHGGLW